MSDYSARAESAPLGSQGVTKTGPGQRLVSRDHRHRLKVAQRELTEAKASKLCFLAGGAVVTVTVGPNLIAHVAGVHRCGSVWSCPVCAPVVRQGRALEIDQAVGPWLLGGGSALFVTATGPHRKGDALGPLFDLTAKFGEKTMTGALAKRWRVDLGMVGLIRALEVTYGSENGWHPHVHSVFLFDDHLTPEEVAGFRSFLFGRWQKALAVGGFGQLHPVHGLDVRPVYDSAGLSEYVAAVQGGWGVGLELARADAKRSGTTPLDLLAHWALGGDVEARELWGEYERATFGRRAIQWTPGLRRRLLPDVEELSDEDLAAAEAVDEVLVTVEIAGEEWNLHCRRGEVGAVLQEIEQLAALFLFMAGCSGRVKESADATG